MQILILNGPNLNLLGTREPSIYGSLSFANYLQQLEKKFPQVELVCHQSNSEGKIIDLLHQYGFSSTGIVLNAGAYTHTSIAIHDAIRAIQTPVIEVHISNVYGREAFRHHSLLAAACQGVIAGLGLSSYELAVKYFVDDAQPT